VTLFGWEGKQAGLVESNGSLPPGEWFKVTCRLTACTPASAPGSTLGNEYRRTLPLPFYSGRISAFLSYGRRTDVLRTDGQIVALL